MTNEPIEYPGVEVELDARVQHEPLPVAQVDEYGTTPLAYDPADGALRAGE